jgi:hypothetical protein
MDSKRNKNKELRVILDPKKQPWTLNPAFTRQGSLVRSQYCPPNAIEIKGPQFAGFLLYIGGMQAQSGGKVVCVRSQKGKNRHIRLCKNSP